MSFCVGDFPTINQDQGETGNQIAGQLVEDELGGVRKICQFRLSYEDHKYRTIGKSSYDSHDDDTVLERLFSQRYLFTRGKSCVEVCHGVNRLSRMFKPAVGRLGHDCLSVEYKQCYYTT